MCKGKGEDKDAEAEGGDDDLYFANDVEQSLNWTVWEEAWSFECLLFKILTS